jgi:hypothetical protein
MTPDNSSFSSALTFGPIQIIPRSIGWRLLGVLFVVLGFGIAVPAVYSISTQLVVLLATLAVFFVLSGLYLGGIRVK